jgi:hypothetical protein
MLPPEMLKPVLIAGLLLGVMSMVDTLAYGVRTSGVLTRKLAISLSLFNVLMMASRLSNMFSAPILGNFPDKVYQGQYTSAQVLAALRLDLLFVIGGVLGGALFMPSLIKLFTRGIQIMEAKGSLPRTLWYGLQRLSHVSRYLAAPSLRHLRDYSDFRTLPYQFLIYNVFVTCFYSIGVMSTVLAASVDHSVAATAILLSGIVNGIATMTLFLIVDPPGAVVVENCISGKRPVSHAKTMNVTLVLTRLLGTLLALGMLPLMSRYVLSVAYYVDSAFSSRAAVLGSAHAQAGGLDYEFQLTRQASGSLRWVLRAHNNTAQPIELQFSSGREYEFLVRQDEAAVWRSNAGDRAAAQIASHSIAPHGVLIYEAAWDGRLPGGTMASGTVEAEAFHLLTPHPVRISLAITIPGGG